MHFNYQDCHVYIIFGGRNYEKLNEILSSTTKLNQFD